MAQAFEVADRIVVLRHGIVAGDVATETTTPDEVVHMITGDIGRAAQARGNREGRKSMRNLWRSVTGAVVGIALAATAVTAAAAAEIEGQDLLSGPDADRRVPDRIDRRDHQFMAEVGYEVVSLDAQNQPDRSSTSSTT